MPTYFYKAKDSAGNLRMGKMQGNSKSLVKTHLRRMRMRPILIQVTKLEDVGQELEPIDDGFIYRDEKGNVQINLLGPKQPTTRDIIVFTKQFAVMIKSGVPLVQSLLVLGQQQRVRSFGRMINRIKGAVENGAQFSETLEAFPKIFDRLYCAMCRAGEAGGNLDDILLELVTYIEKADKIKKQVKSAMMYPLIIVVVAVAVVIILLTFVVPILAKQFQQADKELPYPTQVVINISNFFRDNWLYIIVGMVVFSILFVLWKRTPWGRRQFDILMLKLPGLGDLVRKVAVGRFCSTMSSMLRSGVNLLECLDICSGTSNNTIVEEFITNVKTGVEEGRNFSEPLSESELFPPMVISMVSVGESTGALDEMLTKVAEFYEDEVDLAVKTLLSMLEPIMIVIIGTIVGAIVIAMYLPIFDLGGIVG